MQDFSLAAVSEREWKPISRNDTNLDVFMNTVFAVQNNSNSNVVYPFIKIVGFQFSFASSMQHYHWTVNTG